MSFLEKKQFAAALSMFNLYRDFSPAYLMRGQEYVEGGLLTLVEHGDTFLLCEFKGDSAHRIRLEWRDQRLVGRCACPVAARNVFCAHLAGAAILGRNILNEEIKNSWQNQLVFIQETPLKHEKKAPATGGDYFLLFMLIESDHEWSIRPAIAAMRKLSGALPDEILSSPQEMPAFLGENPELLNQFTMRPNRSLDAAHCVNLPPEAVRLAKLLQAVRSVQGYNPYASTNTLHQVMIREALVLLRQTGWPLYWVEESFNTLHLVAGPLRLPADKLQVVLDARKKENGDLMVRFAFHLNRQPWKSRSKPRVILESPLWLLSGDMLAEVESTVEAEQLDNLLKPRELLIPAAETPLFMEEYLPRLAEQFPVVGDGIRQVLVCESPLPRLYLEEKKGQLNVWLRFGYGEYELPYEDASPEIHTRFDLEQNAYVKIQRQLEAEQEAFRKVSQYGLKRAAGSNGLFNLRARVDVVDFLMKYLPRAVQDGFEIYGEEKIKSARVNRLKPTLSFFISSNIDWFDLQVSVRFGDVEAAFGEVYRALKNNQRYVKLADGSIGELPEEWAERYRHLFGLSKETAGGLRFEKNQISLLDQLLREEPELTTDEEFQRRRERLRAVSSIAPQPLPRGLQGELMAYQKAGYDWLHFLHEVGFGGCLADDMGLGKTLQVLAFLLSLKEQGASTHASLVVVPRSLLANWQREIEKFVPSLRVLQYHGQLRVKEVSLFDQYDLILTTYGIVVRDIKELRGYTFHYAILDESQAIKNPLSQAAKACRLLKSDHRLVMTGTPVENNTFELWSQFEFINPGLLGSIHSFRDQFSRPIEAQKDEASARLLRQTVYPFILRRTKEQVAPYLPPRSEEVVYGEMETSQKRLYHQVREEYRNQLLNLIEEEGLQDSRMKILEGLLRLRQICIHPRLVFSNFRGESAKFELALEHLTTLQAEGHKALVFSQFVESLRLLRAELDARQIPYAYLDGQTSDRQGQVDRFQNDPAIPFFLISLRAGGVGLNLTAADYVIHLDPWWNPAVEMQASDRTHRIGQDKPVFIYKYILRDTVEEKILLLQEHKRQLVEQLIQTDGSIFKNLGVEDVQYLFS